jgi:hypothetical protein
MTLKQTVNDIMDRIAAAPSAAGYCGIEPHVWTTRGSVLIDSFAAELLAASDLAPDVRDYIVARRESHVGSPAACARERVAFGALRSTQGEIIALGCRDGAYMTGAMLLRHA